MKKLVESLSISLLFVIFFVPSLIGFFIQDETLREVLFKYWYVDIVGLVLCLIYILKR